MTNQLVRKPYPSDVTDAQWEILEPYIPEPGAYSPREPIPRREIVNGILYLLRTGCSISCGHRLEWGGAAASPQRPRSVVQQAAQGLRSEVLSAAQRTCLTADVSFPETLRKLSSSVGSSDS